MQQPEQHFHNRLFGRSHSQREQFRQRVLEVTLEDLRRVTEAYLHPDLASTAVVTNAGGRDASADLVERLQMQVEEL